MDGPQHYREAERLLAGDQVQDHDHITHLGPGPTAVARAQVHATLALAAAFAELIDAEPAADWDAIIEDRPLEEET